MFDCSNVQARRRHPSLGPGCEVHVGLLGSASDAGRLGVRPSMGSVGDCYDNAMCESLFATLECEHVSERRSFRSHAEPRMATFDFIEGWYNPRTTTLRHRLLLADPIRIERTIATLDP